MNNIKQVAKSNLVHICAILLFAFITLLYCFPVLNGQKIHQGDYIQFLGMSKEIVDYRNQTGEEALWTNSMFGGMPAYQISVKHPNNIFLHIDQLLQLYLPRPVGIMFLYFSGFYILLLCFKINPHLCILGALAFGFSSYFFIILEAGHNTKAHALAYISPCVASMIYCFKRGKSDVWVNLNKLLFVFLCLGLHLRANHLQITYYLLFIISFFGVNYLFQSIKSSNLWSFFRSSFIFFIGSVLAIAINLGNIWTTYEYSEHTTRGKSELLNEEGEVKSGLDREYATAWSYGKLEIFNMLFPNFFGGSSHASISKKSHVYKTLRKNGVNKKESENFIKTIPLYFGPQSFTSGPVYIGSIVWLLFFISLFTLKKSVKWVLLLLIVFSLVLSWGKNFPIITNLFFDYFPLYNKFRTVSMILIIAQFAIPLLAIIGMQKFIYSEMNNGMRKKIILKSIAILFSISIFFLVFKNLIIDFQSLNDNQFPAWFVEALVLDRIQLFQLDILRSLFFICIASFILYFIVARSNSKQVFWIYLLIGFVFIDMWFVNKRYLNSNDFVTKNNVETPFQLENFDQTIKRDTSIYRVYNLNERLDQGARTSYFHHSVGGYHGAKLGKYQEVLDKHLVQGNLEVINMLNTKYIILPNQNGDPIVQQNPTALGNAWFVDSIKWASTANEEIDWLSYFNPKTTAIVNTKYNNYIADINVNVTDSITISSYFPNKLIYDVNVSNSNLAVFSEIFYPKGWTAYIDGVMTPHFPVNYILRGLFVPSNTKEIIFEFKPKSFFLSSSIAFVVSFLFIIMVLMSLSRLFFFKK